MKIRVKVYCDDEDSALPGRAGELTTEHAASCYGWPVLVVEGQAYGPSDLSPRTTIEIIGEPMTGDWEGHDLPAIRAREESEEMARMAGYPLAFELPQ